MLHRHLIFSFVLVQQTEKTMEFSMLHRHLIFGSDNGIYYASQTPDIQLCLLVQQTGTIIADDMYLCIELACTTNTYFIAE